MRPILLTGATGNIGKSVLDMLLENGEHVRLGVRTPDSNGSMEVHLDFSDPATYSSAVGGCKSVFLLRPPAVANTKQTLNILIDKAYAAGVDHIVFISVTGADTNSLVPHHTVEQKLKNSGKSYTILRSGFFSQNLGDAYREDIKADSRIFLPSKNGLINFIDTRDISEVAFKALVNPNKYSNGEYLLVGQEAVTFYDVADILTSVLGRKIRYEPASVLGYWRHLRHRKMPMMQVLVQTVLHAGIRKGQAHFEDDSIVKILGRQPRTIEEYIKDNKMLWWV